MRRLLGAAAVVAMLAVAAAVLVVGPRFIPESQAQAERAPVARRIPVLVAPVETRVQRVDVVAVGTSQARRSVMLHPAVAGEVVAVRFEPGQMVEEGDVLLELDRRAATVQLELARARLAEAQREFERTERLGRSGAIAIAEFDAAATALDVAKLEVRQAEVALEDRTVRAPFGGRIGITDLDPGDRVAPETPIAPLDDRSTLLVNFEIPELFLGRLREGDPVAVATWTAGEIRAQGRIVHIGTRVDPQRRTFAVRAQVDNPDDQLRPGMSFRVTLPLEGREFPTVPDVSLQWGDDGAYVWVVDGDRVRRVPVTIVQRTAGQVLVDAELAAGAPVVTEGVQSVRQGVAVEVVRDGDTAQAPPAGGGAP